MDSAIQSAYNVTRGVLLSDRVVSVSNSLPPTELLALVLNGPGRNPASAVWLTKIAGLKEMPRLFAFDLACLNADYEVIQVAGVGPGTPLPPFAENVKSVLFLPDQCLANSGTVPGDVLKICTEGALPADQNSAPQAPELQRDSVPVFEVSVEPARSFDPFGGSLIFLPESGPAQSSEFFLPSRSVQSSSSGAEQQPAFSDFSPEVADTAPGTSAFSEPGLAHSGPDPVPELPSPVIPAAPPHTSLIEPPQIHQLQSTTSAEREVAPGAPAQLPRNLKAILQQVDEQIRRETIQPSQPSPPLAPEPPSLDTSHTARDLAISDLVQPSQPSQPEITPEIAPPAPIDKVARTLPAPIPEISKSKPASPPPEDQQIEDLAPQRRHTKLSFGARVQRWLAAESPTLSGNRRNGERITIPGLVAFYWTGGAPKPHDIINISHSGLYLRSKELWSPNTLVRMSIERPSAEGEEKQTISVLARVVRADDDGVGHEFITSESIRKLRIPELLQEQGTDRKALERFLAMR